MLKLVFVYSVQTPDGVVKKDHWKALLRCENFSKPNLKVAYKLTPQHIDPKGYQVMNVPLAFEVSFYKQNVIETKKKAWRKYMRDSGSYERVKKIVP